MKIILYIVALIIGIVIGNYLQTKATVNLNANIIIFNRHNIPYKEPIGRTLTHIGVGLEDPTQNFDVVVEYVVNKEKFFESFTLPVSVLQNRILEESLPIVVEINYFKFIPKDYISRVKIDDKIIKCNYLFNSNYRKFIKE